MRADRAASRRARAHGSRWSCGLLGEPRDAAPSGALQVVDHPAPVVAHARRRAAEERVGASRLEALWERELREEVGERARHATETRMSRLLHRLNEQLPRLEIGERGERDAAPSPGRVAHPAGAAFVEQITELHRTAAGAEVYCR